MSATDAHAAGYVPITDPYQPSQMWMADAALKNLRKGGIAAVLVTVQGGVEIWRQRRAVPKQMRGRDYQYHALSK